MEMALKAVLRLLGVEVPRVHDVGMLMKQRKELFPPWFGKQLDRIAMISRRLRNDCEVSFYGDETLELPPDDIFGPVDAENALAEARFVLEERAKLLDEHETA